MRKFRVVTLASVALLSGCGLIIGTGDFTDQEPSSSSTSTSTSTSTSSGATCTKGDEKACGTGTNMGACKQGKQTCQADGTYGACEGEVLPKTDDDCLASPKVDANCNGTIDCPCNPGDMEYCYDGKDPNTAGIGTCKGGSRHCKADGTGWDACEGQVLPAQEDCTTPADEDCNGTPLSGGCLCVPGAVQDCFSGAPAKKDVGICKHGTQICNPDGKTWGTCTGEVLPLPQEDCATPQDDDCDGQANNACPCNLGDVQPCYTAGTGQNVGICHGGMWTCMGNGWGPCVGEVTPKPEDCATPQDDDCDGVPNQASAGCVCTPNATVACYTGPANTQHVGSCKDGTKTCNALGTAETACMGEVKPIAEDCTTAADDDCDGTPNQMSAGCKCLPNTTQHCYSGAAGTENVGLCKGGTQTCAADGKSYGGCVGEVNPATEDCSNSSDEDCNGSYCTQSLWSADYGTAASPVDEVPNDIAVDANANSYVTGLFTGQLKFGALAPITGLADIFFAKLDSLGTPSFATVYGDATQLYIQSGEGTAVDSVGNVYVGGYYRRTLTLGGNSYGGLANDGWEGFLAKFDPSGNIIWSKQLGPNGALTQVFGVAVDTSDNVYVSGSFGGGSVDFGSGSTVSPVGQRDIFVAKYNSSGAYQFAKTIGASLTMASARRIAVDKFGNTVIVGDFNGTITIPNLPTITFNAAAGTSDQFVMRLDSTGKPVFGKSYGVGKTSFFSDVKFNSSGEAVVVGRFQGSLTANGCAGIVVPHAASNAFVLRLDAGGLCKSAKQYGNTVANANGSSTFSRIAIDSQDNEIIGGSCFDTFDVGTTLSCGVSQSAPFLLKTDKFGGALWARTYGASGSTIRGLALDSKAVAHVAVANTGTVNFGNGNLVTGGANDVVIAAVVTQ
jgi:hypothetical protein